MLNDAESGLDDLYREVILDHYKSPRNRGEAPGATLACEGVNPVCGDEIHLSGRTADGKMAELKFFGRGCAISQASASMMTETLAGRSLDDVRRIGESFKRAMKNEPGAVMPEENGDLEALEGVKKYPVRIKCALLAWETLAQGLG